jgi:hypothetical protein
VPDPLGRLDETGRLEPRSNLEAPATAGVVSAQNALWLTRTCGRLEPFTLAPAIARFLHNDLQSLNLLVRPRPAGLEYAAMSDWDDAAWGDPALELARMPLRAVPFVLEGNREVGPLEADETVEARVLWDHLAAALKYLENRPDSTVAHSAAPPAGRLLEVIAFALSGPEEPWARWLAPRVDSSHAELRHHGRPRASPPPLPPSSSWTGCSRRARRGCGRSRT